jgi:hypothetical protein
MDGPPDQHPDRYDAGSPIELLPNGARQVLIHGAVDDTVPMSQSEQFERKAAESGDKCSLVKTRRYRPLRTYRPRIRRMVFRGHISRDNARSESLSDPLAELHPFFIEAPTEKVLERL